MLEESGLLWPYFTSFCSSSKSEDVSRTKNALIAANEHGTLLSLKPIVPPTEVNWLEVSRITAEDEKKWEYAGSGSFKTTCEDGKPPVLLQYGIAVLIRPSESSLLAQHLGRIRPLKRLNLQD